MKHILSLLLSLIFAATLHAQTTDQLIAKSDSLISIGAEFYESGNYAEALPYFTEAHKIEKTMQRYGDGSLRLLTLYFYLGAQKMSDGDISGLEDLVQYCDLVRLLSGENSDKYAIALHNLATYYSFINNYNESRLLEEKAVRIMERTVGKDHPNYAVALESLIDYNYTLGRYNDDIELQQELLEIRERSLGKSHPDYAKALNDLAFYNFSAQNYDEAIRIGEEVLKIRERILGKNHPDYAVSLDNLVRYNYSKGNHNDALRISAEVLSIMENSVGKDNIDYVITLNNTSYYHSDSGDNLQAIKLAEEALAICERILEKDHPVYAATLNNLAIFNYNLKKYEEATILLEKALSIYERTVGKDHPNYFTILNNLSQYYYELGNYSKAIILQEEKLEIIERNLGNDSYEYATTLNNLTSFNCSLGNYPEALRFGEMALAKLEHIVGKDNEEYASALSNLAACHFGFGNCLQAMKIEVKALAVKKHILGEDNITYATSLNNLANFNTASGNHLQAIKLGEEVLAISQRVLGTDDPVYAIYLANQAVYHYSSGNCIKALNFASRALTIQKRILNPNHPAIARTLRLISDYAFCFDDEYLLEQYTTEANTLSTDYVRNTFANLTASERQAFWDANKYWYETSNNLYAYRHPTPALISNALNATLLAKGILLNTERNFSDLILESGDAESATLFSKLQSTRNQLNRLYAMPPAQRPADTDSLERLAREQERRLLDRSKIYGDFTRNLTVRWQDIRQHLTDSDIAIEFVSFPLETDSVTTTRYAAYIIGSRMEAPAMVPLFDDTQLARIPRQDYYTTPALSSLVWGKLRSYIDTARTIYFAPAGELYNIAVEALPALSGEGILADTHTIHRLSSTRQIALARDRHIARSAALYGGLAYDAGIDILQSDQQRYAHVRDIAPAIAAADSLNLRGGISDLPGSRIEIRDISASFRNTAVEPQIYTGAEGTEASFKALSGKKTSIIHIATHGFFWTQTEARRLRHLNFLRLNENAPRHTEDKALTRSGLLFAGANNALTGKPIPEDTQDGILTAHEIARLDLSGLDLVVLSACQTGLGEITGDGVFGLQRGFKKAGAESILMSLWKVDDDATRILMTRFYEHLLAGHTKHDSLLAAQRHLRQYRTPDNTRPYAAPRYWAAFILLDAI